MNFVEKLLPKTLVGRLSGVLAVSAIATGATYEIEQNLTPPNLPTAAERSNESLNRALDVGAVVGAFAFLGITGLPRRPHEDETQEPPTVPTPHIQL